MITQEMIKEDLLRVGKQLGYKPSCREYKKHGGKYGTQTIFDKFDGSWNDAIKFSIGDNLPFKPKCNQLLKPCETCGAPTTNPKYCSRSCAVKTTNRISPKRMMVKKKLCQCGKKINMQSKLCRVCHRKEKTLQYGEKEIGEFRKIDASKNRYQLVRSHAHEIYNSKRMRPSKCLLCDYKNHLDLCHIDDICSFPDDTKIKIINSLNNLVFLCPNHHWDLGHGKLNKDAIRKLRDGAPCEI